MGVQWHSGSIVEALGLVRSQGRRLLAYIYNKPEDAGLLDSYADVLGQINAVTIKLKADSEDGRNFVQVYPVVWLPILYIIGTDGKPMKFVSITDQVKADLNTTLKNELAPLVSADPPTSSAPQSRPQVPTSTTPEPEPVQENTLEGKRSVPNKISAQKAPEPSPVQQLVKPKLQPKKKKEPEPEPEPEPYVPPDISNIRIRFEDGTILQNQFKPENTVQDVINYIQAEKGNLGRDYELFRMAPRKLLTSEDFSTTLRDLACVPSGNLIVRGSRSTETGGSTGSLTAASLGPGGIMDFFWSIMGTLKAFFLNLFGSVAGTATSAQQSVTNAVGSQQGTSGSASSSSAAARGAGSRFASLDDLRRRAGDDDKERRTWNGDSTQQEW
eukprot:Clim_evm34s152 gene=Clim_evmTU34s152